MISCTVLALSSFLAAACAEGLIFPPGFKFGVASSAYQVEGAWNVSDKSESIWDHFSHKIPSPIANGSTGDIACDSYHKWRDDINLVAETGAQFYRISIAWPRLLPSGFSDHVSEDGKKYYSNLIDGLLEKGIEPIFTLYHWELPQKLQELGGWTNPLIIDWFAEYVRVVYSLYGDRVKTFITINEPWVICDVAYFSAFFPPAIKSPMGAYICTKNVLMAHAKAWRIYDEEFRSNYHGQVALANHLIWMEAANANEEPTAELLREYQVGRFSHAIYSKEGGWPPAIEKVIANFSESEGYPRSMLPSLTKEEIQFVKGTYDFYAVNLYTSRLVRMAKEGEVLQPWPIGDAPLFNAKLGHHPDWPTPMAYYTIHPEGLRKQLVWLKKQYGDIPFFITENGRGTQGGLHDIERIEYLRDYLKQVLLAIQDGVNVTGYTVWSIIDNFEWVSGYNTKFGLYEVDFSSPLRTRTLRDSAKYYASIIKSHSLDVPYNFTSNVAPKSSKPEDTHTQYIIFGGLIMVVVLGIIAAIVGWRVNLRARKEKQERKHQYAAVKSSDNNDDQNDYTRAVNGAQDSVLIGVQNSASNNTQDGQNDEGNGAIETKIPSTT